MECQDAERLRNIALVSIARELRVLVKRRELSSEAMPRGQDVALLKRQTDEARKALRDHLSTCKQCHGLESDVQEMSPVQQTSD